MKQVRLILVMIVCFSFMSAPGYSDLPSGGLQPDPLRWKEWVCVAVLAALPVWGAIDGFDQMNRQSTVAPGGTGRMKPPPVVTPWDKNK